LLVRVLVVDAVVARHTHRILVAVCLVGIRDAEAVVDAVVDPGTDCVLNRRSPSSPELCPSPTPSRNQALSRASGTVTLGKSPAADCPLRTVIAPSCRNTVLSTYFPFAVTRAFTSAR